jgi:hypothetical protein
LVVHDLPSSAGDAGAGNRTADGGETSAVKHSGGHKSRGSRRGGMPRYDLDEIAERMEIISPTDIELVKFLGAGGYGEVRQDPTIIDNRIKEH